MSVRVRTDEQRARMNALYAALRKASEGAFLHNGLLFSGVPPVVVKAYVGAGADGVDPVLAAGVAWFGHEAVEVIRDYPGGLIAIAARGWVEKLAQIERGLAGAARAAA